MVVWYIISPFGTFYGHFGIGIFPVLVCCTKKNLATLIGSESAKVSIFYRFGLRVSRLNLVMPLSRFVSSETKKINMQTAGVKEKNVFVLSVALKRLRGKGLT
jgi:hypothetical protein